MFTSAHYTQEGRKTSSLGHKVSIRNELHSRTANSCVISVERMYCSLKSLFVRHRGAVVRLRNEITGGGSGSEAYNSATL